MLGCGLPIADGGLGAKSVGGAAGGGGERDAAALKTPSWRRREDGGIELVFDLSGADLAAMGGAGEAGGLGAGEPRFRLHRGHRAWELTFEGKRDVLGDELGLRYVNRLLKVNPGEPVNALALLAEEYGVPLLQEGSLGAGKDGKLQKLRREALQWKAVLDDPTGSESQRAKAMQALEDLVPVMRALRRSRGGNAARSVEAVRLAIRRLQKDLADEIGADGGPHPVFTPFAEHLRRHVLIPSARYARRTDGQQRAGMAALLVYERPAGIVWAG